MTARQAHDPAYRGVRWVTVACTCGWISEGHRSRGEAKRAHDAHRWLATRRDPYGPVGVDAHRRGDP